MRIHLHFSLRSKIIFASIFLLCCFAPGICEEAIYIRVIAHDDTALMQQQKLLIRDRILTLLAEQIPVHDLQKTLQTEGIPASVHTCLWAPAESYPSRPTLMITIGKGEGHNWWGVLNPDIYRTKLFETPQKSSVTFQDAAQNKTVVFPFLDSLFRLLWKFSLISGHPAPAAGW